MAVVVARVEPRAVVVLLVFVSVFVCTVDRVNISVDARRRVAMLRWMRSAAVVSWVALAGCAPAITQSELARRIEAGSAPPILDVRSALEFAESHVPGAVHIPFYSVMSRSDELPTKEGEPLVVYCEHGPRAGLARAGLWMADAGEVRFLEGHMTSWKANGLPVESLETVE